MFTSDGSKTNGQCAYPQNGLDGLQWISGRGGDCLGDGTDGEDLKR